MDNELLSDILATERNIRQQIADSEEQVAQGLKALQGELDLELARTSRLLQEEEEGALQRAAALAEEDAEVILAEARAFARRLGDLAPPELDEVLLRHLVQILPAGTG